MSKLKGTQTEKNLLTAFAGESQARNRYTYAASQVTKIGVGSYSCMIPVLTSGYWNYRWEGTGAVYAAMESRFLVAQTAFTNPQ